MGFTCEKLIFVMKNGFPKNKLRSILSFSIGNYHSEQFTNQRLMIMFKVSKKGRNSYAIGFQKQDEPLTDQVANEVFGEKRRCTTQHSFFTKRYTSEKNKNETVRQIKW